MISSKSFPTIPNWSAKVFHPIVRHFRALIVCRDLETAAKSFQIKIPERFVQRGELLYCLRVFRPHFAYNRPEIETHILKKERANFNRVAAGAKGHLLCRRPSAAEKKIARAKNTRADWKRKLILCHAKKVKITYSSKIACVYITAICFNIHLLARTTNK